MDGGVPDPHRRNVQPVRLHHWHLGGWLREAPGHSIAGDHPADIPWRQLLLSQSAAADLAGNQLVQSYGVPDQRISMELLRRFRCEYRHKPGYDALVSCAVPADRVVDLPHWVSAEELRVLSSLVAEDSSIRIVIHIDGRFRPRFGPTYAIATPRRSAQPRHHLISPWRHAICR